jgi:hypothetical protein
MLCEYGLHDKEDCVRLECKRIELARKSNEVYERVKAQVGDPNLTAMLEAERMVKKIVVP